MLDVHPPEHPAHTWRDFFIHIATICVGLLIAVGIEQTVEAFHHRHQRQQLTEDLLEEAQRNHQIIQRDLILAENDAWFATAITQAAQAPKAGVITFTMTPAPCIPGYLGTRNVRYFAPSEAVWTTANESGLTGIIPAEQARIYARLAHNEELLANNRDHLYLACERVSAFQVRFATRSADGTFSWRMSAEQADRFGDAAAESRAALHAILARLKWTLSYEESILNGAKNSDVLMMNASQQDYEK